MLTGWQTIDKGTYYLGKDGAVCTGWKKIGGKLFLFSSKAAKKAQRAGWPPDGKPLTGKSTICAPAAKKGVKGARYTSEWVTIKGERYYFKQRRLSQPGRHDGETVIQTIGKLASRDMKKSGILASVTTAQAILESGYGTSSLAMEAHNLFEHAI